MRMSRDSYEGMNKLVAMLFDANAVIDNLAYSLDYHYYNRIAEVVHHYVAHAMPALADEVSDQMLKLSARPVRYPIGGYLTDYEEPVDVFKALVETLGNLRQHVRELIEIADLNDDDEVRIFAEEFLMKLLDYVKQSEEWLDAAGKMDANKLNVHIKKYTHFINIDDD